MEKFPMFCNQFENEGILYLYNELDVEESNRFETHVVDCPKCQMALGQFNKTRDVYRKLESEIPSMWTLFLLKFKSRRFNYSAVFNKFLSKLPESKKIWIPAMVSTLALILICLSLFGIFNKDQKVVMNPEEILEWTILSDDSIGSLNQQIDEIFAENFTINEVKKANEKIKFLFDEDLGLTDIQHDIIFLSWDIHQSYF